MAAPGDRVLVGNRLDVSDHLSVVAGSFVEAPGPGIRRNHVQGHGLSAVPLRIFFGGIQEGPGDALALGVL